MSVVSHNVDVGDYPRVVAVVDADIQWPAVVAAFHDVVIVWAVTAVIDSFVDEVRYAELFEDALGIVNAAPYQGVVDFLFHVKILYRGLPRR